MQPDEDEVWKGIVDHYGDRAELDPDDAPDDEGLPEPPVDDVPGTAQTWRVAPSEPPADAGPGPGRASTPSWDDPDADWSSDRFVPPPPPPLPVTTRDRYLAWLGLFGAPVVLVVLLVLGLQINDYLLLLLVGSFVGGFVYLVVKMSREPRDPDDDGAVL